MCYLPWLIRGWSGILRVTGSLSSMYHVEYSPNHRHTHKDIDIHIYKCCEGGFFAVWLLTALLVEHVTFFRSFFWQYRYPKIIWISKCFISYNLLFPDMAGL